MTTKTQSVVSDDPRPTRPSRQRVRHGAGVMELAITLGVLLSLTFGMVEFGYYFYVKNTLEGAAREGARASIVSGATNLDVTSAVSSTMSSAGFASASYSTLIQDSSGNTLTVSSVASGTSIVVKVQGTWSVLGNGFRPMNFITASKTVLGTAVMRKE